MRIALRKHENGSAILYVLGAIVVISAIGANVLLNCSTRFNASARQVKAWKEALYAAEAGGDVGYAECRKFATDLTHQWSSGWTATGSTYSKGPFTYGTGNSLSATAVVDVFSTVDGNPYYRIRANGSAPVLGFKRTSMDDRLGATSRGDSWLRKIDFNYDHFISTYGPNGDGLNTALVPVSSPKVTRRIELVALPITPFEAAVKCASAFSGPGAAGRTDSYNSSKSAYDAAAATNPANPHYADARSGSVLVGTSTFNEGGPIYGDLGTNGANATHSNTSVSGVIDNTVTFTLPPLAAPTLPTGASYEPTSPTTITPTRSSPASSPDYYLYSSITGITINPRINPVTGVAEETYVVIKATGDVSGSITINDHVHAKIYFAGNFSAKARDINNNSTNYINGVSNGIVAPGNLQFYGISPASGTQSIDIAPPGNFAATFYAPSADFLMHGNPDVYGAIVCKTFSGNGNTSVHYDRALDGQGAATDYRLASYVEDVR